MEIIVDHDLNDIFILHENQLIYKTTNIQNEIYVEYIYIYIFK